MSRIHPAAATGRSKPFLARGEDCEESLGPIKLTVWKRSSMTFQGTDGFTVFDRSGRLAFRVDNYSRKKSWAEGGLVLMDGAGNALLTLRPQVNTHKEESLPSIQFHQLPRLTNVFIC